MMHASPSPARPLPGLPWPLSKAFDPNDDDGGDERQQVVAALNGYRAAQPLPYQSHFRVLALAVFEDSTGAVGCVVGANNESCALANSLCGERAALAQLKLLPNQPVQLLRMYVVTDDAKPLFPGMLCREFLSSVAGPETPIIVAGAAGTDIRVATLGELYPCPSMYRHVDRKDLLSTGAALAARGLPLPSEPAAAALYREVMEATGRDDRDHLHPIRLAAGVLFADGGRSVSWQKKGIEYGTTVDACAALAQALEEVVPTGADAGGAGQQRREARLLLQADQHGILHAPSGAARAFLKEFGHQELRCLVHCLVRPPTTDDGGQGPGAGAVAGRLELREVAVRELTPAEPIIEFKG